MKQRAASFQPFIFQTISTPGSMEAAPAQQD